MENKDKEWTNEILFIAISDFSIPIDITEYLEKKQIQFTTNKTSKNLCFYWDETSILSIQILKGESVNQAIKVRIELWYKGWKPLNQDKRETEITWSTKIFNQFISPLLDFQSKRRRIL